MAKKILTPDQVYKILRKFVVEEVEGADFCDPEADAIKTLKRWWNKNKYSTFTLGELNEDINPT